MIAVFYHCYLINPLQSEVNEHAYYVTALQMTVLAQSGLASHASEIHICINGGDESRDLARLICPVKSNYVLHGLDSCNENLTIECLRQWAKSHPGWNVLYFHAKGASHPPGHRMVENWRDCMMNHCVRGWTRCQLDLQKGFDSVGVHWLAGMGNGSQNYWGGNFWWAKSNFLSTLPPITNRVQIKRSGIKHPDSRYEAEVWIGTGPRLPKVKDYHPGFPVYVHQHQ